VKNVRGLTGLLAAEERDESPLGVLRVVRGMRGGSIEEEVMEWLDQ